jgi:hypothetical protein
MLILSCPFCGSKRSDDWECLAAGHADFLSCDNRACSMSYAYLIQECLVCGNESVFTWKEMPGSTAKTALLCQHCAEPFSEAAQQAEGPEPRNRI